MTIHKLAVFALFAVVSVSGAFSSAVHAQVVRPMMPDMVCTVLGNDLHVGSFDSGSNTDVTKLQTLLSAEGYFPYQPIGIFGPLTFHAAQRFQAANGVRTTGYVGPITRGVIQSVSCGSPTPVPSPTVSMGILSISPISGPVGTTVSLTGYGFTSDNTILFANGAIRNVPITSTVAIACFAAGNCHGGIRQTLTFTIPSSIGPNCPPGSMCAMYLRLITPGDYTVAVQNSNGTSNSMTFTVTSATPQGQALSISGIDAPAQLSVGQTGTWSVHVSNTGNSTNLHYGVVWGDETPLPYMMGAVSSQSLQSSATVTHTYTRSGTFTPVFTVTNDAGQSATISSTVTVN
jgi:peptidoglycan hydrolase-like protein with peptidoglycan-binding domain